MESKPKNREWVKNAAIVFLVILLILTFFSNTIMNIALPEVATQMVNSGTITAKVRGSGTVVANGFYEVKAKQTREIRSVMVRAGQQVNAGDVLFVLGSGDSEELAAAQEELRSLEVSYQTSALSSPVYHYETELAAIEDAKQALAESETRVKMTRAVMIAKTNISPEYVAAVDKELIDAQNAKDEVSEERRKLTEAEKAVTDAKAARDSAKTAADQAAADVTAKEAALKAVTENPASTEEDIAKARADLDTATQNKLAADAELANCESALKTATDRRDALDNELGQKVRAADERYDKAKKAYDAVEATLSGSGEEYANYKAAKTDKETNEKNLERLQTSLEILMETNNRSAAVSAVNLGEIANKIAQKKKQIEELSGGAENQVVSNVAGTVQSVSCTAGSKVPKDEVMCTIEIPDQGYSLSFSVTSEQARRLHTGDTATVSNYYWGREVIATLVAIKADPKNPQGSKILEFDLSGEVNAGAELTISVGQKSANYDLVVPNSAIRKDNNGSFVLAIEAKNSPLGNRYYAKRVKVEVLASDDVNSAVTGDLNAWSDYVITTSNTVINNKDQVRMADS